MVIPLIQNAIPTAMLVVTQNLTFSWSWNGGVMGDPVPVVVGDLVPVDLDSVWPMEHPLRCLSRAGLLIECCLLLEEDPLDLIQSFLWAITSRTLPGTLVGWFWPQRLFAQRVNVDTKDRVTIVGITWLPQLPFQSSLVRQNIFVPRMRMASYPTNIRTFNPSMWETWISSSFSGNAWKRLLC
jgi:hypothetical protein